MDLNSFINKPALFKNMGKFNRDSGKRSGSRSSGRNRRDSGRSNRRDYRGSGRSSDRSNRRDSGRSSFEKRMHEVICDKCGQSCEVPFKPTGGKPVYCSDCFRKGEGSESRSSFRRESRPRQESNKPSAEFQQINAKLDKILEMLNND